MAMPYPSDFSAPTESLSWTAPPEKQESYDLLSFSLPIFHIECHRTSLKISAQLQGMFWLTESPRANSTNEILPVHAAELTCYRRNLFQITGSVTLPRIMYTKTEQGDRIPIVKRELTVSATESVEGKPVKIIYVAPAATLADDRAVAPTPKEKAENEPPSILLDTMAGHDMDSYYTTFPVDWKRLQFRRATANNGCRKELQQYFIVHLTFVVTLATGTEITICEARSGRIIVRGRGPGKFKSDRGFLLNGRISSGQNKRKKANRHRS
ncbi:conserved hypothetical protein [Talaromyces stipitatus ATCC 10500]|uniref:NDT80 domain-containing protein n=1 Tax=Talaromyces stipitatus (strain ATCC 10500 / CBS 375.48 / QM 6759 / NRRL 1006) TaxID=441959 RepID=B8MUP7_TALSN|nr:uncharacterized protein TSTA_108960 [Talaromyces stipitatus ATCC 10500]EED11715.1 conserved hypothetical protein [Talaromyces stipitatus ATCC 10500]